jgi:hypothetical protein
MLRAMEQDNGQLLVKLRAIEEQADLASAEVPEGLTADRMRHIQVLARFVRMHLEDTPST